MKARKKLMKLIVLVLTISALCMAGCQKKQENIENFAKAARENEWEYISNTKTLTAKVIKNNDSYEFEQFSKEELIFLIKNKCFLGLEDAEFDVLSYRAEKCMQMESQYAKKANELLGDYIKQLSPYDGKPFSAIPDDVIKQAGEAMRQREAYLKKEHHKKLEYKKIQKRMDEILAR